ncbi:hypothetical protein TNIN_73071 [Trichonephila inaurata madagascariensis]|uniref:Uncharacterized protein n=1 Tax=Trichonephila inaurata madagascariensis TaxID=2747483 RepID=A0A8X6MC02_9ARAC|nr:hypothetical protein TNIN_73071 [Trichonephila inaurata madagascariensis]
MQQIILRNLERCLSIEVCPYLNVHLHGSSMCTMVQRAKIPAHDSFYSKPLTSTTGLLAEKTACCRLYKELCYDLDNKGIIMVNVSPPEMPFRVIFDKRLDFGWLHLYLKF